MDDTFILISALFTYVPLIVGLWNYRKLNTVFKLLLAYTIWGGLGEIGGYISAYVFKNGTAQYNVYVFVEAAFILLIYYKLIQLKYVKNLIGLLALALLLYKVYFTVTAPNGLYTPEDTFRSLASFIIITSALFLYYEILKVYDSQTSLYKQPVVWLNAAFLLYFMANIFTFMIRDYMTREMGKYLITTFIIIHSIANISMNLLLAYSFSLCRTEQKLN